MARRSSIQRRFLATIGAALVMLLSQPALALTDAELARARKDIEATIANNHAIRSRYVLDGARFTKAHRDNPMVYDVGLADDSYESALGWQSDIVGDLGVVAESAFSRDELGMKLGFLPEHLKMAQAFENQLTAKYDAVRNTNLTKSDRACYERQITAARLARQVHEETLLIAVRYLGLFGGDTLEGYAARKQRLIDAEDAYYAERAERRKITDESALILFFMLAGLVSAP